MSHPDQAPPSPESQPPSSCQRLYEYAEGLIPDKSPTDSQSVTRRLVGSPDTSITFTHYPKTHNYGITIRFPGDTEKEPNQQLLLTRDYQIKNLRDVTDPNKDEGPEYQERVASGILTEFLPYTTEKELGEKTQIWLAVRGIWRTRRRKGNQ